MAGIRIARPTMVEAERAYLRAYWRDLYKQRELLASDSDPASRARRIAIIAKREQQIAASEAFLLPTPPASQGE